MVTLLWEADEMSGNNVLSDGKGGMSQSIPVVLRKLLLPTSSE
jgi:hypothetical protein